MKLTYHSSTVRGYLKTPRFRLRQRERSIPDQLVRAVLRELEKCRPKHKAFKVVTSAPFMRQMRSRGLYHPQLGVTESLVLQLEGKKLVTVRYDRQMLDEFSHVGDPSNLRIL